MSCSCKEKSTSLLLLWVQQRMKRKSLHIIWAFFVSFIGTVQFLVSCYCTTETLNRPFLLLCEINYSVKIPPTKNKETGNSRLFTLDSFFFAFWGKEGLWRNTICFVDKFPSLKRNKCTLLRMNLIYIQHHSKQKSISVIYFCRSKNNKMKSDLNIPCPQCLWAAWYFLGKKRATVWPDKSLSACYRLLLNVLST